MFALDGGEDGAEDGGIHSSAVRLRAKPIWRTRRR